MVLISYMLILVVDQEGLEPPYRLIMSRVH